MKYILFLLLFISSVCFGQGINSMIYVNGTGWVVKKLVDSAWTSTQIANLNSTVSTLSTTVTGLQSGSLPAPGTVTNAMLAGSITAAKLVGSDIVLPESQITNLSTDLAAKAPSANPTFTGTVTLPALSVTNGMLAGSIPYSKLTLTGAVLAADLAGSIPYSKLTLTGAILNADLAGSIAYSKLALTGAILNADLAGSIAYSKLALTGAILNADLAGSIAYSKLSLTGAILNADLAGSIAASKLVGSDIVLTESQTTNLVTDLAAKQGMTVTATPATTGTMTTTFTAATSVFTITPTGSCTFNGTGGTSGQRATFVITTSGTSSFTLTWGTNFKTTATLATGTTTGKVFDVSFLNIGGTWTETGRTAAM